jgi:hypothetical protein
MPSAVDEMQKASKDISIKTSTKECRSRRTEEAHEAVK